MQESTHTGFITVHGTVQHLIGHAYANMHVHSAYTCILSCTCKMHWHMSKEYAYTGANAHVHEYAHAHLQMPTLATPLHILC